MSGGVPRYVEFWAKKRPRSYKANRAAYEAAIGQRLPVQFFPLLTLHAAAFLERTRRSSDSPIREVARRHHPRTDLRDSRTVFIYGAESKMAAVLNRRLIDILENWDA